MKKILFIDQDGTIILEPESEKLESFNELVFLPGVITSLSKIAKEFDYEFVMVTNQDGLGTEFLPKENFYPPHKKMLQILEGEGVFFREVCIDCTYPEQNADTRKPGIGMLRHYLKGDYDIANSFVIGDRYTDALLAKNLGCRAIHIQCDRSKDHQQMWMNDDVVALHAQHWDEIYSFLKDLHKL